ncbi:hypothetical protein OIU85_018167 [Salix viminalis]|uniref:Uncharacterized protein n=1 Tax=Salix viminalis TaxID=40686 RepID=A0A9Q0UTQ6_SALVM|nr:hypothetical protein OIU85_018167 [Salix viminalis]
MGFYELFNDPNIFSTFNYKYSPPTEAPHCGKLLCTSFNSQSIINLFAYGVNLAWQNHQPSLGPCPVTVMTFLVAALLLMSSEVANATLNYDVASGLQLGRRALLAETAGRGGYNAHPDGRGGYNAHPDRWSWRI